MGDESKLRNGGMFVECLETLTALLKLDGAGTLPEGAPEKPPSLNPILLVMDVCSG